MKSKIMLLAAVLMLSFGAFADGGHGSPEVPETPEFEATGGDLLDATLGALDAFKDDNKDLVKDYGAIRVRKCEGIKGVQAQIKTKTNGTLSYKCLRSDAKSSYKCFDQALEKCEIEVETEEAGHNDSH